MTPLEGVRVLDLSANLPGPLLTRILADLGAEIIKVEPPRGEGLRHMPPSGPGGIGRAFGGLSAGKDSVALDLKSPDGVALALALAEVCDVLVESFRPGKLAAMGLDPEALMARNPGLIVCSLSGYGQSGEMAGAAGHDLNYLAWAGLLGLFGPAGAPPPPPGVQIADVGGGTFSAAVGVLAALMERQRTGRGRHLDISLAHGSVAFGAVALAMAGSAGLAQPRGEGLLDGGAPCYRCYETLDGRHLALGALEPRFFATLCRLAGRPDLAARGFSWGDAAAAPTAALEALFKTRTAEAWLALTEGHDVCLTLVRTPEEALADPALSGVIHEVGGFSVISAHLGAPTAPAARPPSALGADAPAVVERLGLDPEVVRRAVASGALRWPAPPADGGGDR